ncbi:MAG: hypothetical protein LBE31_11285 [Deltaproteobacteria bacterium]|nr:hypothetical protein [Deltaproteobacteria bacterium]
MKILPFKPHVPSSPDGRSKNQTLSVKDFQANLDALAKDSKVLEKITMENHLASQGSMVEDVNLAGDILNSVIGQIRNSPPGALQKVHNLDGILYYFQL